MYLAMAMVGIGIGNYVHAIFPAISVKAAGLVLMAFFYVINLNGISLMAKLQKVMTAMLIVALAAFAIVGTLKAPSGAFDLSQADYFLKGASGFFSALILLVYSTSGQMLVCAFSWDAQRPRKDIPLAIIISTLAIFVLYIGVSFAGANVLPVAEVAGKPLTSAALKIFPGMLYYAFVFGGPLLALLTTLNSGFAALTAPILGGVRNGWLPSSIARTNKHGAPVILYTTMFLIGALPLLFGVPLNKLTNYTVITQRITGLLLCIAMFQIPVKFKDVWEKSWLHIPAPLFYLIAAFATLTEIGAVVLSAVKLGPAGTAINLCVVAVLGAVALIRHRQGKVHSQPLVEISAAPAEK